MRFSIRALLAAIAYLSLIFAAIYTQSPLVADAVWAVSLLAICYAAVVAVVARGPRQAGAIGFIILSTANVAGTCLVPNRTPVVHMFSAAGYFVSADGYIYDVNPTPGAVPGFGRLISQTPAIMSAMNAVMTMAVGLVGCIVGIVAFKNSRSTQQT